jgi:hypothetical protein
MPLLLSTHRFFASVAALVVGLAIPSVAARAEESNPYAAAVLADRPISFHRCDEAEGKYAEDATGNEHRGALKNVKGGEPSAHPALGTCFVFNGKSSRVQIPAHSDYKVGKGDFSVEFWFNCHNPMNSRGEILKFKGEGKDFGILKPVGNSNFIAVARPDRPFQAQTDPFSIGVWHHAVYVRRGGVDHWYLDGSLTGTSTGNSLVMDMNADILIGADHHGDPNRVARDNCWNGLIDELAIYASALTAGQVEAHYKAAQVK